jgi:PAS domain S-box-containing protein
MNIIRPMAADGNGAARQEQASDLQLLVNSAPSLIHTGNPDGYLDFFNQTWLRYVGRPLEDLQGWKWTAFIHPEDVEGIVEKWRASLASGESFVHEARVLRADSQYRWMLHHKVAMHDGFGQIVKWYGSSIDIEDRKRVEGQLRRSAQELQRSEFYLAEGQRLARMGSWAFDHAGFDYWSPELFRMHGLDPARKPPGVQEYLDLVHPEDRESMADLIEGILAEPSPFDATKRIVRPNGEVRYIRCVGIPVVGSQGLKNYVGSAIDVTGHELMTQELRRREAYLTEAQTLSHTGSFGWRPDTGEIVWSDETYSIFEYDRAEKPTMNMLFERIHPHDRALVQQVIDGVSRSTDFEHEYRLVMPGGGIKHIHVRAHALADSSGNLEVVGALTDITERKTAEDKIGRLVDAGILGIFIGNVEGEIVEPNQAFVQMLQYDRHDLVSGRLRWADLTPAEWRDRDERAMTEVLANGIIQPYEKEFLRKDGSRVPVLIGSALFQSGNEGVVFVLDLSEQKRAEEALRRSESYLAQAQRLSQTGSFGCKLSTGEMFWSEETFRIYGYDRSTQPAIERVLQRVHPEDRAVVQEHIDQATRFGKDCQVECRLLLPDDSVKYVRIVAHASKDEAGTTEFIGAVTDITERKTAEDKIREQETELRQILDLAPPLVAVYGPKLERIYANRVLLDYLGLGLDEWRGRPNLGEALHPDDRERATSQFDRSVSSGAGFELELRISRHDGSYRWFLARCNPMCDDKEQIMRWYFACTDIDDRKQAEEKIRQSEAELLEAQRISHTGSWKHDLASGTVTITPEVIRMFDAQPGEDRSTAEFFFGRIHPEDRPGEASNYERAALSKTDFESDYRIVLPDGSVRHVHNIGHPKLNEAGDLVEFVGTVIDVTAAKEAEKKIRQSEREAQQLVDLSPLHITLLGPDGSRIYNNRAALDYFGLTLDAGQGSDTRSLIHPQDAELGVIEVPGRFLDGVPFEVEMRLRRRDGQYRWFQYRFSPMVDEQGCITRWCGAGTDIEERKAAEQRLQDENVALREEIGRASMFEEIVGTSAPLKAVLSRVAKVAPTDSTVLITGETGTGKELIARAVHTRSQRSGRPFVSVNCAALAPALVSSELFGHEKGAFTGATQRRPGRFEMADGGTIFLDEVGELLPDTQASLLRVLQEREFERLGGSQPVQVDVRVIAATNRDLNAAVANGIFRHDLLYRLNVFPIEIPPLRERRDDILILVEYFVKRYAKRAGRSIRSIDQKTADLLQSYDWPGNIRELQNVIERSIILNSTDVFSVDELWLSKKTSSQAPALNLDPRSEREIIETALGETRGRVSGPSGAAAKLGMSPSTLEGRIKALNIDKRRFKYG